MRRVDARVERLSVANAQCTEGDERRRAGSFHGKWWESCFGVSLPQFMNFKLFGKTILVVNIKFGLVLGHRLSKRGVDALLKIRQKVGFVFN